VHKVGDVFSWNGAEIEVIGGPNLIENRLVPMTGGTLTVGMTLFTVRAGATDFILQTNRLVRVRAGETGVVRAYDLDKIKGKRRRGVVEAHCPNCDEPDMIFYIEDYICAWCREHLEDAVC
jgi:hypothetical protein